MNHLNFARFVCLIGIVGFFFVALTPCVAQDDDTGTLSGRVLDIEGEPVAGFTLALPPVMMEDGGRMHVPRAPMHSDPFILKTDENGMFAFNKVKPGPVQILILPQQFEKKKIPFFEADDEIVSIKIGDMTLHQDRRPPFGGITFGIQPNSHVKNVEVTVRPRMRIRTRVVFEDGTPLANASIFREVKHQDVDGRGEGRSSGSGATDADGYFVHYIDDDDVPAFYTVSVKYKGLSAESEEFLLEEGARYDDLVLTLDGEAPPSVSTPPVPSKLTDAPVPKPDQQNRPVPPRQMRHPDNAVTWVVNPENGHAYAKIRCSSLDDAKVRAAAEEAYLVAINDEAEQKWLSSFFGNYLYWIGLSGAEKEGEWIWQNGEPLTYTNWGPDNRFFRSIFSSEKKEGVVMTFVDGEWHAVGHGDLFWHETGMALLEKDDFHIKKASEDE